jgi:N-acetylglutamate synthase/N-acetylornithine aminotransferase
LNKPKKYKAKKSKKKYALKTQSKKTKKKLEVTVALDLGKTAKHIYGC